MLYGTSAAESSLEAAIGKSQPVPCVVLMKSAPVAPDEQRKEKWYSNTQQEKAGQPQTQSNAQMPATEAGMVHIICPIPHVPGCLHSTICRKEAKEGSSAYCQNCC